MRYEFCLDERTLITVESCYKTMASTIANGA